VRTSPLNATLNPTQLRLVIALAVTIVCLPLLVLDQVGGSSGSSEASMVETGVPEPSLVAAVGPTEAPTTGSTEPSTTEAPTTATSAATQSTTATTAAPVTTTTRPRTTTTTAAPQVYVAPTTTAAPAPPPPAPGGGPTAWESSFLSCVRHRESRGVYTAVDPSGQFMGAYQIYQGGWNAVASSIGRSDLVGVQPHRAAPADQDTIALAMLRQYGTSPWGGYCG
jgi:hypothetical protein